IPRLFTELPPISDSLVTDSSRIQDETLRAVLPWLTLRGNQITDFNSFGIPALQRRYHASFLNSALEDYPSKFTLMDASRPWFMYWALAGLSFLGEDIDEYRDRTIYTLDACQNLSGGYGGGHGHYAHLATTYATVLALCMVGGRDAYDSIDRKAMWHWIGSMKQRDGGFTMCTGGEQDVRGAYCAMTIIALLNLPLDLPPGAPAKVQGHETFLTGLGNWISRCQSYEGGIGASPGNEAHGAYAFCGLACLCIIGPPHETIPKYLDIPSLLSWMSSRQQAPEGGFTGRTNKLVDGCYSHWVGGTWTLLEAALAGSSGVTDPIIAGAIEKGLWSREGLTRWILCAAQNKKGGLRDKPGKPPDAYHSNYNLAGLSAAQHHYTYDQSFETALEGALEAPFKWVIGRQEPEGEEKVWDRRDEVEDVHPVFVVPWGAAELMRRYFE
ncbi:CaaX farnesyltransferase beta subunit Ram1, partial [Patellaria atrata CBS 101060]